MIMVQANKLQPKDLSINFAMKHGISESSAHSCRETLLKWHMSSDVSEESAVMQPGEISIKKEPPSSVDSSQFTIIKTEVDIDYKNDKFTSMKEEYFVDVTIKEEPQSDSVSGSVVDSVDEESLTTKQFIDRRQWLTETATRTRFDVEKAGQPVTIESERERLQEKKKAIKLLAKYQADVESARADQRKAEAAREQQDLETAEQQAVAGPSGVLAKRTSSRSSGQLVLERIRRSLQTDQSVSLPGLSDDDDDRDATYQPVSHDHPEGSGSSSRRRRVRFNRDSSSSSSDSGDEAQLPCPRRGRDPVVAAATANMTENERRQAELLRKRLNYAKRRGARHVPRPARRMELLAGGERRIGRGVAAALPLRASTVRVYSQSCSAVQSRLRYYRAQQKKRRMQEVAAAAAAATTPEAGARPASAAAGRTADRAEAVAIVRETVQQSNGEPPRDPAAEVFGTVLPLKPKGIGGSIAEDMLRAVTIAGPLLAVQCERVILQFRLRTLIREAWANKKKAYEAGARFAVELAQSLERDTDENESSSSAAAAGNVTPAPVAAAEASSPEGISERRESSQEEEKEVDSKAEGGAGPSTSAAEKVHCMRRSTQNRGMGVRRERSSTSRPAGVCAFAECNSDTPNMHRHIRNYHCMPERHVHEFIALHRRLLDNMKLGDGPLPLEQYDGFLKRWAMYTALEASPLLLTARQELSNRDYLAFECLFEQMNIMCAMRLATQPENSDLSTEQLRRKVRGDIVAATREGVLATGRAGDVFRPHTVGRIVERLNRRREIGGGGGEEEGERHCDWEDGAEAELVRSAQQIAMGAAELGRRTQEGSMSATRRRRYPILGEADDDDDDAATGTDKTVPLARRIPLPGDHRETSLVRSVVNCSLCQKMCVSRRVKSHLRNTHALKTVILINKEYQATLKTKRFVLLSRPLTRGGNVRDIVVRELGVVLEGALGMHIRPEIATTPDESDPTRRSSAKTTSIVAQANRLAGETAFRRKFPKLSKVMENFFNYLVQQRHDQTHLRSSRDKFKRVVAILCVFSTKNNPMVDLNLHDIYNLLPRILADYIRVVRLTVKPNTVAKHLEAFKDFADYISYDNHQRGGGLIQNFNAEISRLCVNRAIKSLSGDREMLTAFESLFDKKLRERLPLEKVGQLITSQRYNLILDGAIRVSKMYVSRGGGDGGTDDSDRAAAREEEEDQGLVKLEELTRLGLEDSFPSRRNAILLRNALMTSAVVTTARQALEITTFSMESLCRPYIVSRDFSLFKVENHKNWRTKPCFIRFNGRDYRALMAYVHLYRPILTSSSEGPVFPSANCLEGGGNKSVLTISSVGKITNQTFVLSGLLFDYRFSPRRIRQAYVMAATDYGATEQELASLGYVMGHLKRAQAQDYTVGVVQNKVDAVHTLMTKIMKAAMLVAHVRDEQTLVAAEDGDDGGGAEELAAASAAVAIEGVQQEAVDLLKRSDDDVEALLTYHDLALNRYKLKRSELPLYSSHFYELSTARTFDRGDVSEYLTRIATETAPGDSDGGGGGLSAAAPPPVEGEADAVQQVASEGQTVSTAAASEEEQEEEEAPAATTTAAAVVVVAAAATEGKGKVARKRKRDMLPPRTTAVPKKRSRRDSSAATESMTMSSSSSVATSFLEGQEEEQNTSLVPTRSLSTGSHASMLKASASSSFQRASFSKHTPQSLASLQSKDMVSDSETSCAYKSEPDCSATDEAASTSTQSSATAMVDIPVSQQEYEDIDLVVLKRLFKEAQRARFTKDQLKLFRRNGKFEWSVLRGALPHEIVQRYRPERLYAILNKWYKQGKVQPRKKK